ncbi:hypothetical protein N4G69_36465 [Streptomyces mirabilis]|uniref:hypothetical protein n=1 Tax=Streptomyces mirabilis TaxID=68239 RepID=UPI0021BEC5C2|nr:hypothetical protein [Streptomyces mirabilis]MCT9111027.1 hypothetical protein [Streptomyces mirabilis]
MNGRLNTVWRWYQPEPGDPRPRDAAGAVVLAVVGTDGRLHVRRRLPPAVGSPLGPWR